MKISISFAASLLLFAQSVLFASASVADRMLVDGDVDVCADKACEANEYCVVSREGDAVCVCGPTEDRCGQFEVCADPSFRQPGCVCEPGARLVNGKCVDIDECFEGTDTCVELSVCSDHDPPEFFKCECPTGFTANNPTTVSDPVPVDWRPLACIDVNECLVPGICPASSTCVNTAGSFQCLCDEGFDQTSTLECVAEIVPPPKVYANKCEELTGDACDETGETYTRCVQNPANATDFSCQCLPGFALLLGTCREVDECKTGAHDCDTNNGKCVNLIGAVGNSRGFNCECNPGFEGFQTCSQVTPSPVTPAPIAPPENITEVVPAEPAAAPAPVIIKTGCTTIQEIQGGGFSTPLRDTQVKICDATVSHVGTVGFFVQQNKVAGTTNSSGLWVPFATRCQKLETRDGTICSPNCVLKEDDAQLAEESTMPSTYCEYDPSTQRSVFVGLVLDLFGIAKENRGTTSLARAGWSTGLQGRAANINPVAINFPANETVLEMYEGMIVQFQPRASNQLYVHSLEGFGETGETSNAFSQNCGRKIEGGDFRRLQRGGKGNLKIPELTIPVTVCSAPSSDRRLYVDGNIGNLEEERRENCVEVANSFDACSQFKFGGIHEIDSHDKLRAGSEVTTLIGALYDTAQEERCDKGGCKDVVGVDDGTVLQQVDLGPGPSIFGFGSLLRYHVAPSKPTDLVYTSETTPSAPSLTGDFIVANLNLQNIDDFCNSFPPDMTGISEISEITLVSSDTRVDKLEAAVKAINADIYSLQEFSSNFLFANRRLEPSQGSVKEDLLAVLGDPFKSVLGDMIEIIGKRGRSSSMPDFLEILTTSAVDILYDSGKYTLMGFATLDEKRRFRGILNPPLAATFVSTGNTAHVFTVVSYDLSPFAGFGGKGGKGRALGGNPGCGPQLPTLDDIADWLSEIPTGHHAPMIAAGDTGRILARQVQVRRQVRRATAIQGGFFFSDYSAVPNPMSNPDPYNRIDPITNRWSTSDYILSNGIAPNGGEIWHVNADEPGFIGDSCFEGFDGTVPNRFSRKDPIMASYDHVQLTAMFDGLTCDDDAGCSGTGGRSDDFVCLETGFCGYCTSSLDCDNNLGCSFDGGLSKPNRKLFTVGQSPTMFKTCSKCERDSHCARGYRCMSDGTCDDNDDALDIGDLAFNCLNPDGGFTFVALRDVSATTTITFTATNVVETVTQAISEGTVTTVILSFTGTDRITASVLSLDGTQRVIAVLTVGTPPAGTPPNAPTVALSSGSSVVYYGGTTASFDMLFASNKWTDSPSASDCNVAPAPQTGGLTIVCSVQECNYQQLQLQELVPVESDTMISGPPIGCDGPFRRELSGGPGGRGGPSCDLSTCSTCAPGYPACEEICSGSSRKLRGGPGGPGGITFPQGCNANVCGCAPC